MLKIQSQLAALPREARDSLFLVGVIAWIFLPLTPNLPLWCVGLTVAVLAWRSWIALTQRPLPGRWALALVMVIAAIGTYISHRSLLGRDPGVTLIAVLLALKTLELKGKRDAFVVFFLGFFTLLTNFFYSQSLLVAAAMLIAVLGLLCALVNAHMTVGRPPLAASLKIAGMMTLLGAPIMAVLFMLFPRLAPLWGIPSDGMAGRSGLSSQMTVGNIASLALDESIAFRVEWLEETGERRAAEPITSDLYFRGPVLSSFDGRQWTNLQSRFLPSLAASPNLVVSGRPIRHRVTMEPNNRPWIFMLESPGAAPKASTSADFSVNMSNDLQWRATRPVTDITRYEATSYTSFRHGPTLATDRNAVQLQDYLELPPGFNPRTLQWASDVRRDPRYATADGRVLTDMVLDRLRTGGYTYTLEPGVNGQHTADEFWFDTKLGFCEHISSAFVIAMRALDVPARVVTGYQGGLVNSVDGIFTVRQSDAHAWAEVWVRGQGWVRVDPTASVAPGRVGGLARLAAPQSAFGGALAAVNPGFAKQVRAFWEAANSAWNQRILNYTQSKQLNLLKNIGFTSPSWEDLGIVLALLLVSVSSLGALWTLWTRHERDPWLRLLKRARATLSKHQIVSTDATTPRELAKQASERLGQRARPFHDWLLALEAQRYAPEKSSTSRASLGALRGQFKRVAAGLR